MIKADDLIARRQDSRHYLLPHELRRAKPMNEYYCRCIDRPLTGIRQHAVIRLQVTTALFISGCRIKVFQSYTRDREGHYYEH